MIDAPASEYADGSKSWYQNGQLHRTDGPAIEYADGRKRYGHRSSINGDLFIVTIAILYVQDVRI